MLCIYSYKIMDERVDCKKCRYFTITTIYYNHYSRLYADAVSISGLEHYKSLGPMRV